MKYRKLYSKATPKMYSEMHLLTDLIKKGPYLHFRFYNNLQIFCSHQKSDKKVNPIN